MLLLACNIFAAGIVVGLMLAIFVPADNPWGAWLQRAASSAHAAWLEVWHELKVQQGLAAPLAFPSPTSVWVGGAIASLSWYLRGHAQSRGLRVESIRA